MNEIHLTNSSIRQSIYNLFKHVNIELFPDASFIYNDKIISEKQKIYRRKLDQSDIELFLFDIVDKHSIIDNFGNEKLEKVQFSKTTKEFDFHNLSIIVRLFFNILGNDNSHKGIIEEPELKEFEKLKTFNRYWFVSGLGRNFSVMINYNEKDGLTLRILV